MDKSIAVLIPAYQPDEKLVTLTTELLKRDIAFIVVDDGSTGKAKDIIKIIKNTGTTVISHETNKGKGAAIKTGLTYMKENGYLAAISADADGQHTPDDIIKIMQYAKENPSKLILGCRDIKKMPPKSKLGNSITKWLFNIMYGIKIKDTQTGLRAIPIEHAKNFDNIVSLNGDRYEYEMNMLIYSRKLFDGIIEVDIDTVYIDNNSSSHFRPIRDGAKIYIMLFKQVPTFFLSSVVAFCVDYSLFSLFAFLIKGNVVIPTVLARIISSTVNFSVNKFVVFKGSKNYSFFKYFTIAALILIINCILMFVAVNLLQMPKLLAKIIVEVTLYVFSFITQSKIAHKS